MAEEVISQTSDLDKGSSDTQVDRDTTVSDIDVGQAERIRANTTSYDHAQQNADLENQRRDRAQADAVAANSLQFTQQMQAVILQGMQNMVNAAERNKNQDTRHVDHTMIDLHEPADAGSSGNPGTGVGGTG